MTVMLATKPEPITRRVSSAKVGVPAKPTVKPSARIVGRIRRPSDGLEVFLVESRSHPGALWRVEVRRARLVCGCPASVYTGRCAHRTSVHEWLSREHEEKREERKEAEETSARLRETSDTGETAPRRAPSGVSAPTTASSAPGADALLRRSNRPFSLLKR